MKLALIFLAIFVTISHQQHYRNPRMMFAFPWLALPFPINQHPDAFYNDYEGMNEGTVYPGSIMDFDSRNGVKEEGEELADVQSRIKGISRYRHPPLLSFQDQQNARFLFNLFASTTSAFNNPLLKTATFTSTQILTLVSVVSCVPSYQVIPAPVPACRRKRQPTGTSFEMIADDHQFPIDPSETIGLLPTDVPPSQRNSLEHLTSSKDEVSYGDLSTEDYYRREKRFFINKNQFVVSSTVTSFSFVNQTITATINLISPVQFDPAVIPPVCAVPPAAAANGKPGCITCLPTGLIICPAAG